MKQLVLSLIFFLFIGSVNAQILYESPHVKEGKTVQFDLPAGFYEVADVNIDGVEMFARQKNLSIDDLEELDNTIPVMAILHLSKEENSYESILNRLKDNFEKNINGITILDEPKRTTINGLDVIVTAAKGEIDGQKQAATYLCGTTFGDYFILITYSAKEGIKDVLEYDGFKEIIESWKEVATEKEDRLKTPDWSTEMPARSNSREEYYEEERFGSHSAVAPPAPPPVTEDESFPISNKTNYINDLSETEILAANFWPNMVGDWLIALGESSHLLSEFVYKKNQGSIKIFSGGLNSNYGTDEEKVEAIQLVMGTTKRLRLTWQSEFSNDDHKFQVYAIAGVGNVTITTLHTTIINDELVFFIADGGANPVSDFNSAVHDFMLTMWVDYSEE